MTSAMQTSQQLIEQQQGLVRSLAGQVARKLPPYVELEDLIEYGQVGLAEAARDFDAARGGQFSTYAYFRIRGAIYDGLAKMAWFSRAQYHRLRYERMSNEMLREDVEASAGIERAKSESQMRWLRDLGRALAVVHFASQRQDDTGGVDAALLADSSTSPTAILMKRETSQALRALIEALPARESALIKATYFEGVTLQEAGQRLGIGKAWASRLHTKVLQRLARSLRLMGAAT